MDLSSSGIKQIGKKMSKAGETKLEEESLDILKLYSRKRKKKVLFILFSLSLLAALFLVSLKCGSASIGIKEGIFAVLSKIFPYFTSSKFAQTIIWELRLPRICMAIVAGASLSLAGVVMQNILRNPLASPYTLGVASGAGFGAALAIVLGAGFLKFTNEWMIITNAFVFSLLPAFVILGLVRFKSATSSTLVLAGIAMMYLFSAGLSLLQYLGEEHEVTAVVYWLFGSLSKASWRRLEIVATITFLLAIPLIFWSWDFNALSLGDEVALSLGVNVKRIRLLGMVIASLITAGTISFLGTIGFIGLVAPHMTRIVIGGDHRFLLPASSLLGAIILLAADTAARTILSPVVLPVGILTSFLGVPLFLYLILKRRRVYW